MLLSKLLAHLTHLLVTSAIAIGLSIGAFAVLPAPGAGAIWVEDCTAGGPGTMFLHDTSGSGHLCAFGQGQVGVQVYNKNYVDNRTSYHGTICNNYDECFYVDPNGGTRLLDPGRIITSVILAQ